MKAHLWKKLTQQLDQIALYSDQDQELDEYNRVRLSTYHQVKGLEFRVVFMHYSFDINYLIISNRMRIYCIF